MKNVLLVCTLITFWQQSFTQELKANWQFRQVGTSIWYKATIPGTVHTDLLNNKLIQDPFYRDNETKLQWISKADWEYKINFDINETTYAKKHIEITFEGLDTYANIYLNGNQILIANNMFRTWVVDIKPFIKRKANQLLIVFKSADRIADSLATLTPIKLPCENNRHFIRKAQYHFGWDFAPKLTTCGIWRKVFITSWDKKNIGVELVRISEIKSDSLLNEVIVSGEIKMNKIDTNTTISLSLKPKGTVKWLTPVITRVVKKRLVFTYRIPNEIIPKLNSYKFDYSTILSNAEQRNIQSKGTIYYTNVALIQSFDSIGQSFYFTQKNKPIFIKGANWVPADVFLPRVTKSKYRNLLVAAKQAGINMLRVWGGGIYEDDYFYTLCDSLGIMVWQDFMFAGAMYPSDSTFLENVQKEVIDNLKRLSQHRCIVVWCGNNEIDEAWHNWGWQKQFNLSPTDSARLWDGYQKLFHQILPALVKEYSNQPYITTSPQNGWGQKESMTHGDSHYWGVWWGLQPIETYQQKIPRFMSEYGMQALPNFETIQQFTLPQDWDTSSTVMKLHQKHPTGYKSLAVYLNQNNLAPKSFKEYIQATQLLQAKALTTAITAHIAAQPRCMGTMFWQFNDCYPGASWSVIDFYGRKKKGYFAVQKLYRSFGKEKI